MDPRDRSGELEGEKQRIAGKIEKDIRYMGYYVEYQMGAEWICEDGVTNGQSCVVARLNERSWSQQPRAQAIQILQDLGHVPREAPPGLFQGVRQEFTLSHLEQTYYQLLIGTIPNLRLLSKDENWLQWDPEIYQLGVPSQDEPHYNLVRVSSDNGCQIDAIDIGYLSKRNAAENDEDNVPDGDEVRVLLKLGQSTPTFFRFAVDGIVDNNNNGGRDSKHPHILGKLARLGNILSDDILPSPDEYGGQSKIIGITNVDHLRKFLATGPDHTLSIY
ncbi:unnamed protein product [Zymoseptoria tritici ST99CH_1A5]|uniref:Uncharacterized protein n=1 Tax=Zymoseptoria tritici ST99CH_1A5 TaxID=1276529 RepID=A0A1Y6M3W7_ZYMTR|nr:unnamed protein product [Zymoseptoria tritici ST99CH_1A5]